MATKTETAPASLEQSKYRDEIFITPKRRAGGLLGKEWFLFLLFILPNFFFLAMFTYWPLWKNLRLSFMKTDLLSFSGGQEFVGWENYQWLFGNGTFRYVVQNTVIFI